MASSSKPWGESSQPENAFGEIAPYFPATSSETWDVYINHRGPDVKQTLATAIYHTLHSMGFRVFLDKEALEPGDSIPAKIQHAMSSATLIIAIFSPRYAESPWILAELAFMLKTGKKIIPIYYDVERSDLRWISKGKGKYGDAFLEHERKGIYTEEQIEEWKRALEAVSFRSGYTVMNQEDEAAVLKQILNYTRKLIQIAPLFVCEHPVGLNEFVHDLESLASKEEVKITGILGMGGSGKTTLAKEFFNRNFSSFERCSFVFDVRDAAVRNALPDKQKKLLADLGVHHLPFDTVDEGKAILADLLRFFQMLLVLDDVDHIDQLDALLPSKDLLGSNSVVIVTSRDLGVLISWGLVCIYKMPGLNNFHAKQLFCWHAFLQGSPPAGFETLAEKLIQFCYGLPLSLKVLGGQLYGNDSIAYWVKQFKKISRMLPGDIKQRLKVSYDALDEEEREMFLDVACFLNGERKSKAIAVWDASGWIGLHGLEILVNKCLVELVDDPDCDGAKVLWTPNQLKDMGREIAAGHSTKRIWSREQIIEINIGSMRGKRIRGIQPANAFAAFKEYRHQLMGLSNGLQILSVEGNEFTEEFASLSEDIVWLRWEGFPLRGLPSWLTLRNLRVLEVHGASKLEVLWQENAELPLQLRELIILGNENLQRLPCSIGRLQYLEMLQFSFRGRTLPDEFCCLQSLEHLALSCTVLSSLPNGFGDLVSLSNLALTYCRKLHMLPVSFSRLIHLEELNLSNCKMLSSLPDDFGNLASLRDLNLENCLQLSILPESISQLILLEKLNLSGCEMLSSLPDGLGNLINLRNLNLKYCKHLSMLPDSFGQLRHLEKLNLSGCEKLSSLPAGFGDLISLQNLKLKDCKHLSMLPDSLSQLRRLEKLNLSGCKMLRSLPAGFGDLISLRILNLIGCKQLNMLPDSPDQLRCSEKLCSLPSGLVDSISLEDSNLKDRKQLSMLNLGILTSFESSINLELSKLPADRKQILQSSFHELEEEEREMFLDVACFLNGEKKSKAIAVWDGSGWSGLLGLNTLMNKRFVELIDEPDFKGGKVLKMHDGVADMGREIAAIHSPYRIWFPGQIIDSKKHSTERKLIRAILPAGSLVAFKEYKHQSMGLKILSVEGNEFTEELASLAGDLVWLRWEGFPLAILPLWLPLRNLRVLELHSANEMEGLWKDKDHAPLQLRELIITGSQSANFDSFPSSISYLKHLNKIALLGGVGREFGIKGLPEEFCDLQSLEHLELQHCTVLASLPARFGELRSLRHLDLCSCKELRILPNSFKQLRHLEYLVLFGCKRLAVQIDILENITQLKNLNLSKCFKLRQLPHQITDQAWLRQLRLEDTRLDGVPPNIGQLRNLELLTIGSPFLTSLPVSFGELSSLKSLSIKDCIDLESLPETIRRLTLLEHLCIESSGVRSLPKGLTELTNLQTLKISGCPLGELDFGSGSSSPLGNLRVVEISRTGVARISISQDCCPRLETLHISRNDYLEEIEILPATVKKGMSECEKF